TRGIRLRLLPSGPDLIRVPTSRRTRPSTPPRRTDPDGPLLGPVVGPAKRISGYKAPLIPRLARSTGDPTGAAVGWERLDRPAHRRDPGRHRLLLRDRPGGGAGGDHRRHRPQALRAAGGGARADGRDPDRAPRLRLRPRRR